ncbi:MAG: bifunctional homocysteine S-methyltransferase/methylenetetrahydrofolate reductase [Clostridiales bacterium]|nr:bifunctional homocysteine S-methyltransferase/methylenetetrahydrofolate reductase [Clostridiales bacterium]
MDIRTYLHARPLLFDGAMGTYWVQQNRDADFTCELANLRRPESVLAIHRAYLDAGARAIKTNTFGLNAVSLGGEHALLREAVTAGWQLATEAAQGRDAFVFADLGPVPQVGEDSAWPAVREVLDVFLELGAVCFLFETNSDQSCLAQAAAYVRENCPEAFVLVSFAVQPDGYTREGRSGGALIQEMRNCPQVDAVGLNCVSGAYHMRRLVGEMDLQNTVFSAMPNAGYPVVVDGRARYDGAHGYYALQMAELAGLGVRILGGCCGTTPEHIAQTAALLEQRGAAPVHRIAPHPSVPAEKHVPNRLWDKLERGQKVFAVELDPPKNAQLGKFMAGAWTLKAAGVDAITIADCPIGRASMDSSLLACKLRRELDIDPIPHLTCRDRNRNATKALLLGLNVEGVDNVLLVTGDPVPSAERDEVKSVFQFNSRKLARFVGDLNRTELERPFRVYGALNVNARNFQVELSRAQEKEAAGVSGFLTQPVLTARALENLRLARETLSGKILGGIIPVVSYRNACYMQSEIAGIDVADEIIELYKDKDRAESEDLAVRISAEVARQTAPFVDGYYLMTPFLRVGLMVRIMEEIRKVLGENG